VSAKLHNSTAPGAAQKELPFFLEKGGKGDIQVSRSQLVSVKIKQSKKKFQWITPFLEAFADHKGITGFAMVMSIPLLYWITGANIHDAKIIAEVLAVVAGFFGIHLWTRKPSAKETNEKEL
jgi:hypothetical protein